MGAWDHPASFFEEAIRFFGRLDVRAAEGGPGPFLPPSRSVLEVLLASRSQRRSLARAGVYSCLPLCSPPKMRTPCCSVDAALPSASRATLGEGTEASGGVRVLLGSWWSHSPRVPHGARVPRPFYGSRLNILAGSTPTGRHSPPVSFPPRALPEAGMPLSRDALRRSGAAGSGMCFGEVYPQPPLLLSAPDGACRSERLG